jgi:CRISPR-associated protein Cst1
VIIRFFEKIEGGNNMEEIIEGKGLWNIYYEGQDLKKVLIEKKAENKIDSIAYKLLNALRVGDINTFMDVLIRVYMGYNREIPSSFVKGLKEKKFFYAYGYSFLNGLLGKEKTETKNKEAENNG